jgi:hypothetical protein
MLPMTSPIRQKPYLENLGEGLDNARVIVAINLHNVNKRDL